MQLIFFTGHPMSIYRNVFIIFRFLATQGRKDCFLQYYIFQFFKKVYFYIHIKAQYLVHRWFVCTRGLMTNCAKDCFQKKSGLKNIKKYIYLEKRSRYGFPVHNNLNQDQRLRLISKLQQNENIFAASPIQFSEMKPWHVYQMISQNTMRTYEKKIYIFE